MTLEFQKNIIRYLFQYKTPYINQISSEVFDTVECKALFELLYNYLSEYKDVPDKKNFIEYITRQSQLKSSAVNMIKNQLLWVFEEIADVNMIKEFLLDEVKKKLFVNVIKESIGIVEMDWHSDEIDNIYKKISAIRSIQDDKRSTGFRFLRDMNKYINNNKIVYPTFLLGLNEMTALGGFYHPQNVVFMKGPKSFGTGLMIKFCVDFMLKGLDGFYADFENGAEEILLRMKQSILECQLSEIKNFNSELLQIKQKYMDHLDVGDLYIQKYGKRKHHTGHAEVDMLKCIDDGMDLKYIIWDYADIMACTNSKITEPRLISQQVYADIEDINDRYKTFNFTLSKMTSAGWSKEWPTAADIGEDKEKIYNAHAVFALMRNDDDILNNTGRIIPIEQRSGKKYVEHAVYLSLNPETSEIKELEI